MRLRSISNTRALPAVALVILSLGLGGCDKLTPNGTSTTVALLRSGSERICVAPDVQQILHGLIIPKAMAAGSLISPSDASAAIASVSIAFDSTTLQAADKSVSKATCSTYAKINGADGTSNRFHLTYEVSPSAEFPNDVVVDGDVDDARAFADAQVDAALKRAGEANAQQQQTLEQQQARQKLLATITPRWLIGTWIAGMADAISCSNGQSLTFRPSHVVEGAELNGRWVLSDDHLHAVGQGQAGAAEIDGTIIVADPLTFALLDKNGSSHAFRRCTREETSSTGLPDVIAPPPPETPQN